MFRRAVAGCQTTVFYDPTDPFYPFVDRPEAPVLILRRGLRPPSKSFQLDSTGDGGVSGPGLFAGMRCRTTSAQGRRQVCCTGAPGRFERTGPFRADRMAS